MQSIAKNNPNYTQKELEKIRYGLEGVYLTITKSIILIIIASILGILKEFLIFTILFNGIRLFAFGLHASKSYICLIFSGTIFIMAPFLATSLVLNTYIKLALWILCLFLIILYAPADTYKRPLINKTKRLRFKGLSILVGLIYGWLSIYIDNAFLSNCFLFSLITEILMILPISYKLLKLPYKNYKNYTSRIIRSGLN
jgi:accessory gene regulator B